MLRSRALCVQLDDWVLCRIYKKTGMASPMMAPPLIDYDHMVDHNDLSGGGGGAFDDATGFYTPSSNSSTCRAMFTQHQQRLPMIPPISELFDDDYALDQIFGTEAEHLAVHPSLNQLLSVGADSAVNVEPSYYAPPSSSPAGSSAGKREAASPEEDGHQSSAKRLKRSWFDAPPQSASAVLSGLNHQMLSRF
jgi:hypothetical protein